jgi:hypothetical protein
MPSEPYEPSDEIDRDHWQNTLEDYGAVPENPAISAAEVLQKQHEDPFYQPTPEELHAKQAAWLWMNAQDGYAVEDMGTYEDTSGYYDPYCSYDDVGFPEGQLLGQFDDNEVGAIGEAYHLGAPIPELGGVTSYLDQTSAYGQYSNYRNEYDWHDTDGEGI